MFYGYKLAGALWVFYGLTLGMKAGAWGYFAPEIRKDLGLSATEIGLVAGVVLAGTAVFVPLAGQFISRYGCRRSMIVGQVLGAAGIAVTAFSTPLWQFVVGAILLAASTSFGGVVPIQTLITFWFERYRSRVMAVVFTATPIWGALSYPSYDALMNVLDWRGAMLCIVAIFPLGYLLIALFIKDRPEDVGARIDGAAAAAGSGTAPGASPVASVEARWTGKSALLSPAFAMITANVVVCTLPYLYFVTFGRSLVEAKGVATEVAVAALAGLTLATLIGRLCVSLADFVNPGVLTLVAMVSNVAGMVAITVSDAPWVIYGSVFLMGWSFGFSFLLAPILLADAFGRHVFATVESVRMGLVVGVNAAATPAFGYVIDASGSYLLPLEAIMAVHAVAIFALAAYLIRAGILSARRAAGGSNGQGPHGQA
ncbi:MAG: MFS transporter [Rhodospirillaceae bacterium]|nr:MFS transporter [Rhodospirillaceae bacterium]